MLNKIGAMLAYPALKRVLVENKEVLSLRKIMDERKILLVNVAKGIVGSDTCELLGSLFQIYLQLNIFIKGTVS